MKTPIFFLMEVGFIVALGFVAAYLFVQSMFGGDFSFRFGPFGFLDLTVNSMPGLFLVMGGLVAFLGVAAHIASASASTLRVMVILCFPLAAQAILVHNRLDWAFFFDYPFVWATRMSAIETTIGVLLLLVLLLALRGTIGLRLLDAALEGRGVDRAEWLTLLGDSAAMVSMVLGVSIGATLGLLAIAGTVSFAEPLILRLPWMVLTTGLGATALMAAALILWVRTQARDE
jgi:hypothetical protein